jgi:hypothetical protein
MISPPEKIFWTRTVNRPPETEPPTLANATPTAAYQPPNQYVKQEDLGTREIAGLQAHGVRATQTITAAVSGTGKDVIVADEYWYSNDRSFQKAVPRACRPGSWTATTSSGAPLSNAAWLKRTAKTERICSNCFATFPPSRSEPSVITRSQAGDKAHQSRRRETRNASMVVMLGIGWVPVNSKASPRVESWPRHKPRTCERG